MEKKISSDCLSNRSHFDVFSDEFLSDKDIALQPIVLDEDIIYNEEIISTKNKQKNNPKSKRKSIDKFEKRKSIASYASNIIIIQAKNDDNEEDNHDKFIQNEIKKLLINPVQINKNTKSPKMRRKKNKNKQ